MFKTLLAGALNLVSFNNAEIVFEAENFDTEPRAFASKSTTVPCQYW